MADDFVKIPAEPPHRRSEQYRDIYTNACQVRLGAYDMTFVFGQVGENPPGTFVIEDHASVTMSPQQMKALVRVMSETMEAYEKTFGELTIPEAATRPKFTADQLVARIKEAQTMALTSSSEPPPPSSKSRAVARKKGL